LTEYPLKSSNNLQVIDFKDFLKTGTPNALLRVHYDIDTNKNKKVDAVQSLRNTQIKIKKCFSCFEPQQ
jgi:hypothetical protein